MPVFAETNPTLNIMLTIGDQLYEEGDIATEPVTIHVTTTSTDSATIQVEWSIDEGVHGHYLIWHHRIHGNSKVSMRSGFEL